MAADQTTELQILLDRIKAGDLDARDLLLTRMSDRLVRLTRTMLRTYPGVKRWEQTDDVFQNAALRLWRSLNDVRPESFRHLLSLAATQIRRELIDLARRHYGPEGAGAHHDSYAALGSVDPLDQHAGETTADPAALARWTALHEQAGQLPEPEREVFDLLWYQGLTQGEAAALLQVDVRTIKRRWQGARLRLYEALAGNLPDNIDAEAD